MYCRLMLFKLELKRFVGMLPLVLTETLLLGFIAAGVGVYASRAVYADKAVGEIRAGVVAEYEEPDRKSVV